MLHNLETIRDHELLLQKETTPIELIHWSMKLLGIRLSSPLLPDNAPSKEQLLNAIRVKEVKSFFKSNKTDGEAYYIEPDFLLRIAEKLDSKTNSTSIRHNWEIASNLDVENPSNEEPFGKNYSAYTYTGSEKELVSTINKIMPVWDHNNSAIPITFLLPISDLDKLGWDYYSVSKEHTTNLLKSTIGKLTIFQLFQLFELNDPAIKAIITQLGLVYSEKLHSAPSFEYLPEKYDEEKLAGFTVTTPYKEQLVSLMKNAEKKIANDFSDLIPRLVSTESRNLQSILSLKLGSNTGMIATENDLAGMRRTLSYLLTHSSGVAITLNIPLIHEDFRLEKYSTPTLLLPEIWAETIKAMRPVNNKKEVQLEKIKDGLKSDVIRTRAIAEKDANTYINTEFVKTMLDQKYKLDSDELPHSFPDPSDPQFLVGI
ncbi:hypothetical protein [Thalassotalea montiporae]